MTFDELVEHNLRFSERLTDNIMIAIIFFTLGIIIGKLLLSHCIVKRIRFDYTLPSDMFMRIFVNGVKYIVVNPKNVMHIYSAMLLYVFDKGVDRFVDSHDLKRIKLIRRSITSAIVLGLVWGILFVLSASDVDFNPFNWMRGYRPWN